MLRSAILLVSATVALLLACGSTDAAAGKEGATTSPTGKAGTADGGATAPGRFEGAPSNGEGCTKIATTTELGYLTSVFFGNGMYGSIQNLDAPEWADYFAIKLRMGNGYLDNIPPYDPVPGRFDLADPLERDYATCRHCVFVMEDVSGDHIETLYLAVSGTLVLDQVDGDRGIAVGFVEKVRLEEIEATGYFAWGKQVPTGKCAWMERAAFDTRAVPGRACKDEGDCPNEALQVCTGGKCANK